MRLVVVGAGSQSTPHLFLSPHVRALAGVLQTTLIGRSNAKSHAVARAIRTLVPEYRISVANIEDDLQDCFASSDLIVIQARYGGYAARRFDETFPTAFGSPGDEGLGAGGLANAWRSWPPVADLLQRIHRANRRARIAFLTAPLGILTRCALQMFPALDWYGLCELPFVTLRDACLIAGRDWRDVTYEYAGINHLGWFDSIRCGGTDLLDEIARIRGPGFPGGALIQRLRALPLKYMELHYDTSGVAASQRTSEGRARALENSSVSALAVYAGGDADAIRDALKLRPAPWYYDSIAPFVAFAAGAEVNTPFFITSKNAGYINGLDAQDVLEIPYVTRGRSLERSHRRQMLRPRLVRTLRRFVEFERAAAAAIMSRNRAALAEAVNLHPWIRADDVERITEMVLLGPTPQTGNTL